MAKEVEGDSVIFDAASQYEGWAHRAQSTPPLFLVKPYIKEAIIYGGATGGTVLVTDIDSGNTIIPSLEVAADEEQVYPINQWYDGIWVETLDSGIKVRFNLGYY